MCVTNNIGVDTAACTEEIAQGPSSIISVRIHSFWFEDECLEDMKITGWQQRTHEREMNSVGQHVQLMLYADDVNGCLCRT
jgi:hypothetical protein